ncbi:MAG: hypothetical protein JWM10_3716 [Myxococcaceae bacterium]|nr:hypothetical protein [Myxococcaceae bacterium]
MPDWLTLDDLHRLRPDVARTTLWRWAKRWAADGKVTVTDRVRPVGGRELLVNRAEVFARWGLDEQNAA